MILADRRFGRSEKHAKLPRWLTDSLSQASLSLSVEESVALAKKFLRQMAQPFPKSAQLGISLLDPDQAQNLLKKLHAEAAYSTQ